MLRQPGVDFSRFVTRRHDVVKCPCIVTQWHWVSIDWCMLHDAVAHADAREEVGYGKRGPRVSWFYMGMVEVRGS
jgi:hypothetical protein